MKRLSMTLPPISSRRASRNRARPFAEHPAGVIDGFGGADEDLFSIAAAQRAGAAERLVIDDCHLPAGRAAPVGGDRCRRSGADDREIVIPGHARPLRQIRRGNHMRCGRPARSAAPKLTPPCG
jgi:hypothetical protein